MKTNNRSNQKRLPGASSFAMLAIAAAAALLAMPATARGQLYLGNLNNTMSEYTISGSLVSSPLISGLDFPAGVAVSGTDIFVTNASGNTIGEYTTTGGTVNASLITGLNGPYAIAISGTDIFVTNIGSIVGASTVGEYTTTGGTLNPSLISGLNQPYGIAVSGSDIFIAGSGLGTINEYTTSGAAVGSGTLVSSGLSNPWGIAVSGTDIFVSNQGDGSVNEYTTSGAAVGSGTLVTGMNPYGLAVSGTNLFISNETTIANYTTSGAAVGSGTLISGGFRLGVAVTGAAAAPGPVTLTSQTTPVGSGSSYAAVPALTANGGFGSTVTIAGGIASGSSNVTLAFAGAANYANIASDVVTVSGMPNKGTGGSGQTLTDTFVLELSFDNNAANQTAGGAGALALLWLNQGTGQWVNAILGDSDGGAGAGSEPGSDMVGAYNSSVDDNLSWYGVDEADGYVWAVVDHNSDFAVGDPSDTPVVVLPEPSTWAFLAIGGAGLLFAARRRARARG